MKLKSLLSLALLAGFWLDAPALADVSEMNPMVGTGGVGYGVGSTFPGPCVPFGMARPSPDTSYFGAHASFHHCGGYHWGDNMIRGISHYRLSGIGVADYGNVLVMPTYRIRDDYSNEWSYMAPFSHRTETASAGYYAVTLADSGIRIELTASRRAALHRYTPARDGRLRIVIDASHAIMDKHSCGAEIAVDEATGELRGRVKSCGGLSGRQGGVDIFFATRVLGEVKNAGFYGDATTGQSAVGEVAGAWLELDGAVGGEVLVGVGLSFISACKASEHLDEVWGRDFEEVRSEAEAAWSEVAAMIEVEGGASEERAIFYSALYHAHIMPTNVTEAGDVYRGFDEKVHESGGQDFYTDFSMWDTFRTLHPLLTLIDPQRSGDMMQSLARMAAHGGYMPKWPTSYRYTSCMTGASADNVLADAYLKGVRNFDFESAYLACRKLATEPVPQDVGYDGRVGVSEYMTLGWVPSDVHRSSASRTIEFSYNDWCLANWARAMGKTSDYEMFAQRARNWRNLWDPKTGYLRGRKADGSFESPFLAWAWTSYYVEGNARQWLWAPLHDADGLIEFMGGREGFTSRLSEFFEKAESRPDTLLWDNFYWHGNEPDIHASYLFDFAGRPDLAQKWARWAMKTKYKNAPDGYDGNDDCGTLSAWYIFSALGFYPIAGSDLYVMGSPIFKRARIKLPNGVLAIETTADPADNPYVSAVTIDGRALANPWFTHERIADGGRMVFHMTDKPAPWNENPGQAVSFIDWSALKNPVLSAPDRMLKDQAVVRRDGEFFIFASTRFADDDPERETKRPCIYRTRDFQQFECVTDPDLAVDFGDKVSYEVGSPDLVFADGLYHLVFQAGPDDYFRRLYRSTSPDLLDWSRPVELIRSMPDTRIIDGALAFANRRYHLGFKGGQNFFTTASAGPDPADWLLPARASADGRWAENYQFIRIDGEWRMLATARVFKIGALDSYTGNHEPFIYRMAGTGDDPSDWQKWIDRTRLDIPTEDWNRVMRANSAYLCDWRDLDGYFYLFYAGANDHQSFQGRGHGKIGVVRSKDLKTWRLPGDTRP